MQGYIDFFKVDSKFLQSKSVKHFSVSLESTNSRIAASKYVFGHRAKLFHKRELVGLRQRIQNGKALIRKSNLKHKLEGRRGLKLRLQKVARHSRDFV